MKKLAVILLVIMILFVFVACGETDDAEAEQIGDYEKVVKCLEANELGNALNECNKLNQKTLEAGKSDILEAVKNNVEKYLTDSTWLFNDNVGVVDTAVIAEFKIYSQILMKIEVNENDFTNVVDFVNMVLSLEKYTKWNDFWKRSGIGDFNDALDYLNDATNYSSASMREYYVSLAYDSVKDAYNGCRNFTNSYGLKIMANYYKTWVDALDRYLDGGSLNRDKTYDSQFEAIIDEYSLVLDEVEVINDNFPSKIY